MKTCNSATSTLHPGIHVNSTWLKPSQTPWSQSIYPPPHVSGSLNRRMHATETAQELPKEVSTWPQNSPDANMIESEKLWSMEAPLCNRLGWPIKTRSHDLWVTCTCGPAASSTRELVADLLSAVGYKVLKCPRIYPIAMHYTDASRGVFGYEHWVLWYLHVWTRPSKADHSSVGMICMTK